MEAGSMKTGKKSKKKIIIISVILLILIILILSSVFVIFMVSELLHYNEARSHVISYNLESKPQETDDYFIYVSYPCGNDDLNNRIKENIKIKKGDAKITFESTEKGNAMKVDGQGDLEIEIYSDEDPTKYEFRYENTDLLELSPHYPPGGYYYSDSSCTYFVYFESKLNTSASISLDFVIDYKTAWIDFTFLLKGNFESQPIHNGWNKLNGTYYYNEKTS